MYSRLIISTTDINLGIVVVEFESDPAGRGGPEVSASVET